jgi:hypothetical protein
MTINALPYLDAELTVRPPAADFAPEGHRGHSPGLYYAD